jgi:hypothetical protein
VEPEDLSPQPFDAVAPHGPRDLARDRDAERLTLAGVHEEDEMRRVNTPAPRLNLEEFSAFAQAGFTRMPIASKAPRARRANGPARQITSVRNGVPPALLVVGDRDRDAVAALTAATIENRTTVGGLHPSPEPVGAEATLTMRLIGAFH